MRITFREYPPRIGVNIRVAGSLYIFCKQRFLILRRKRSEENMMPRYFVIVRSCDEPPGAKIERKIFRFHWQQIDRRLNQAASQESRHCQISARHVMTEVHRITGKD